MISGRTAKALTYVGMATTILCSLPLLKTLLAGTEQAIVVIPRVLALVLGGAGFIFRKRAGTAVLAALILAMRLWDGQAIFAVARSTDIFLITGILLGLVGVFAYHKRTRPEHGKKKSKPLDTDVAVSFTRISGAAGLSFGTLLWMFSMAEMGGFTTLNSTNGLLMTLFAWQTLKRQLWAAVAQVILAIGTLALQYANPAGQISVFSFFPLFLLQVHALGVLGVANLKTDRRHGDKREQGAAGHGS